MSVINKDKFFEQIGYRPHRKQREYHRSNARFKSPCCGRRFGKSTMAARDLEPDLFQPRHRYWIVAPTYDLGEKEFRVLWDDLIIRLGLGKDKRVKKAYNKKQGDMYIEFPWRTRVEVRSAQHPENLVGEGLHGVIMSEAAKHSEDTWERYVRPALADFRGWASFPTTPEGQNWYYKLWQLGQNPNHPEYESWRFPSWENTVLYPGGIDDPEIQMLRQTTTDEWFRQEIGAEFNAFVGKIYGEFSEETHCASHVFNPDWPNYIAFDWGYVHPCVALEFQVDPLDNVYVWREHYESYQTLETKLAEMKARYNPPGYRIDAAFGDAAEPGSAAYVSEHLVGCMADPEAKKSWQDGVNLVKWFLKLRDNGKYDEFGTPQKGPKLVVDYDCPNTIREFNNYKAKRPTRTVNNRTDPPDGPQKVDDHAMDALRYGLMHVFKLGATYHLEDVEPYRGEDAGSFFVGAHHTHELEDATGLLVPAHVADDRAESFFSTGRMEF